MNDYYSLRIDAEPCSVDTTDLIASYLADVGFESFVPDERGLIAYLPVSIGDALKLAQEALGDFPFDCKLSFTQEFIEGRDWNEEWEKNYFQPILIDDRCVIHSSFHTDVPSAVYDIVIDPKMAFGTGHHDTTSQMVKLILRNDFTGKSVIDMGTGTGILGILAAMRGAAKVTGIEIDRPAYLNAVENVRLNNVDMTLIHGDASALQSLGDADFIFANINRNIIMADIDRYASRLKPGGSMFLSGFYREDIPIIEEAARKNSLKLMHSLESNRWVALHFLKN